MTHTKIAGARRTRALWFGLYFRALLTHIFFSFHTFFLFIFYFFSKPFFTKPNFQSLNTNSVFRLAV